MRMQCDIRATSFAPKVSFQLAPQYNVTPHFEISPPWRPEAGRVVSYLFLVIDFVKRSICGVVCGGSNMLTVPGGLYKPGWGEFRVFHMTHESKVYLRDAVFCTSRTSC